MIGEDVRPGPFYEEDEGGPTESEWLTIGDRRYKVLAIPSKLPTFVPSWCHGNIVGTLIGLVLYLIAARRSSSWAARIYWQKKRWYNGKYHWLLQEEFDTIDEAKARADKFIQSLRDGLVPQTSTVD